MREIKFRGLRTDGKGWVYGMPVFPDDHNTTMYMSEKPSGVMFKTKIETTGQYTGLKDVNGIEIYEGDIVQITERVVIAGKLTDVKVNKYVRYKEEYAQFLLCKGVSEEHLTFATFGEIIGNIHEHPHLLEGDANET